jgi:5-methylcytosine-specific restriction endonuclease McrA
MREQINTFLAQFDLDIRKSKDARFVDQKCTPDIVCFMADCVLNMIATKPTFVINDIWETQYFIQNSRVVFNKPWANDKKAYNEYNKVLSQPLKLLAYARILNVQKVSGSLTFSVNNEDLLDYISRKDRNAYNFLYCYFTKVLKDSGFLKNLEEYKTNYPKGLNNARATLYDKYFRFIKGNTPTQSRLDIQRMFHKILNVYAVEHNIPGSKGKFATTYSEMMYNKKNWRDVDKDKSVTRKEAVSEEDNEKQKVLNAYYVQKAIALIRKIHKESEVKDQWGVGEATQVHHIFSRAEFPELAHYVENLILLTATQHNTKAHPSNRTQQINKDYQLTCLLAKSDNIEKSLKRNEFYYRKESFVYCINTGLEKDLKADLTFTQIKKELASIYNDL